MIRERFIRSIPGQWFCTMMGVALVIAPFGCETAVVLDPGNVSLDKVGFAFNKDASSDLLMSLSGEDGNTVFVFGSRNETSITSISAVTIRDADGNESFITFESGRPVHVQAADGSYAHITYQNVGLDGLQALVDIYDAVEDTDDQVVIDIDLQETLATWAQRFEEETNVELPVVNAVGEDQAKTLNAAQAGGVVFVPVFVVPFTTLVTTTSLILSQVFVYMVRFVALATASIITAIMYPFIVLAEITRTALVLPAVIIDMITFFDVVPTVPVYVLR